MSYPIRLLVSTSLVERQAPGVLVAQAADLEIDLGLPPVSITVRRGDRNERTFSGPHAVPDGLRYRAPQGTVLVVVGRRS